MYKFIFIVLFPILVGNTAIAQRIENFELNDLISGQSFSLDAHGNKKAVVLIFTSNSCPFSKLYEDRIISLFNQYSDEFQFALINPHIGSSEEENEAAIRGRVIEKKMTIPYLIDPGLRVTRALRATKLPEAVVITSGPTGFNIAYQGAIDNNPQAPSSVSQRYLESALNQILKRSSPSPASTRAVGCNIRGIN
jgi:hypothetical protein